MGMDSPEIPDYEQAAREGVYADLETFPLRYLTEAAAKMGNKITIDGKTYDFTGLGTADNARVMSDKMAQTLLDLQRDLGPEFIKQRLEELKAADPQGYAARQQLFDRILKSIEATPDRPLAAELQASIVGELQNAGRLDRRMLDQVQGAVRGGQVARGNYLGNAATAEEAAGVVAASEGLRDQQQQTGLGFLSSGVTPEDVEYRRIQQSLANLGAYIGGETPTAQFQQLSGAANAAVPFVSGGPNTQTTNPNAGAQGMNWANQVYSGNVNWAQNQVSPWVAGLNFGAGVMNTAVNLGYGQPAPAGGGGGGGYIGDANVWAGGYV